MIAGGRVVMLDRPTKFTGSDGWRGCEEMILAMVIGHPVQADHPDRVPWSGWTV